MSMNSVMPATQAIAIVNDVVFAECRAVYVGVGGTIVAEVNGNNVTFVGTTAGSILPVRCTKVDGLSTATDLIALY